MPVGKFRHYKERDKIISMGWAIKKKKSFREVAFREYYYISFAVGEISPAFLLLISVLGNEL